MYTTCLSWGKKQGGCPHTFWNIVSLHTCISQRRIRDDAPPHFKYYYTTFGGVLFILVHSLPWTPKLTSNCRTISLYSVRSWEVLQCSSTGKSTFGTKRLSIISLINAVVTLHHSDGPATYSHTYRVSETLARVR